MKPQLVSISQLADITGKGRELIRKRISHLEPQIGMAGARNAKLYDKRAAVSAIIADDLPKDETLAKTRKALADAEKAEMIVAKLKSELVSADAMRSAVADIIKTLYARTVRVAPGILAPQLVGKDAIAIEAILRQGLAEVYEELKTMPDTFLTAQAPDGSDDTES